VNKVKKIIRFFSRLTLGAISPKRIISWKKKAPLTLRRNLAGYLNYEYLSSVLPISCSNYLYHIIRKILPLSFSKFLIDSAYTRDIEHMIKKTEHYDFI
jgi:hypothetical protein